MKNVRKFSASVLFLFAWALTASAQVTTAVLQGVVADSQGGVIPGVTVVVTNTETGLVREAPSDSSGFYRASALPPGVYTVTAQLDGFVP